MTPRPVGLFRPASRPLLQARATGRAHASGLGGTAFVEGRRCAAPHMNSATAERTRDGHGDGSGAREGPPQLVVPSSSCAITVEQDYERILADEPEWADCKAVRTARSFTSFAHDLRSTRHAGHPLAMRATITTPASRERSAYHASRASSFRACRSQLNEWRLRGCCGVRGTFSFEHPKARI